MDIAKLVEDIKDGMAKAAVAAADVSDGGTCNLDSVVLRIPRNKKLEHALEEGRIHGSYHSSGYWKGYFFYPRSGGQATKHYVACKAMTDHLRSLGWDADHYMQMD